MGPPAQERLTEPFEAPLHGLALPSQEGSVRGGKPSQKERTVRSRRRIGRRTLIRGAAGMAGAGLLASCAAPQAPTAPALPTAAQAGTAVSGATIVPATAAPVIKYADSACVLRWLSTCTGTVGEGPDDKEVKALQEEALRKIYGLNIDLRVENVACEGWVDAFNTRVETQGCDADDYILTYMLNYLNEPGLLRDVTAEVQQYGQHILQHYPKSAMDYIDPGDGKIYTWGNWYRVPVDCEYIFIRRDWCDAVGRDIPQTLEDLVECLALFKRERLGGDVTIPMASALGGWMIIPYVLTGPFSPEPDEQRIMLKNGEDFEYEYGAAVREQRLEFLRKLYQDGLLDQDWATNSGDDVMAAVSKGFVGCLLSTSGQGRLDQIEREVDPKQDWVQIYPPVCLKGHPETGRILAEVPGEHCVSIFSWAKCPEAVVAWADWYCSSLENYMLCHYGIEGKHWKYGDNGCLIDLRTPPPNMEYSGSRYVGPMPRKWQNQIDLLPPQPGKEPKDPMISKRVLGPHFYNRPDTTKPQKGEYPMLVRLYHLVPWRFKESGNLDPDFLALRDEAVTKMIKGEQAIGDGIKAFWDAWMAAGGDKRIREISDQYDAYIKKHPEMADPKIFFSPENWNTQIQYPPRKKA